MLRVIAALFLNVAALTGAAADQWYLDPSEPFNLGITLAAPALQISAADVIPSPHEVVTTSLSPDLILQAELADPASTAADLATLEDFVTGSIRRTEEAEPTSYFFVLEPWIESKAEYEARLTP
jgi:hypothetical protein